jgi:hypothetical protein
MGEEEYRLYEPNRVAQGPVRMRFSVDPDRDEVGDVYRVRYGRQPLNNEPVIIRQCVDQQTRHELERAADIGQWLCLRLSAGYPQSVSRLVGFNLDLRQPILVTTGLDRPMAELSTDDLRRANPGIHTTIHSLLQAAVHLSHAQVVHNNISPRTVRWEDGNPQLTDFRWASREESSAQHRDDIPGLAAVIYSLASGETPSSPADIQAGLAHTDHFLQKLLMGAFATAPGNRPSAQQLLDRLSPAERGSRPLITKRSPFRQAEQEARVGFAALRERQAAARATRAAREAQARRAGSETGQPRHDTTTGREHISQPRATIHPTRDRPTRSTMPLQPFDAQPGTLDYAGLHVGHPPAAVPATQPNGSAVPLYPTGTPPQRPAATRSPYVGPAHHERAPEPSSRSGTRVWRVMIVVVAISVVCTAGLTTLIWQVATP